MAKCNSAYNVIIGLDTQLSNKYEACVMDFIYEHDKVIYGDIE